MARTGIAVVVIVRKKWFALSGGEAGGRGRGGRVGVRKKRRQGSGSVVDGGRFTTPGLETTQILIKIIFLEKYLNEESQVTSHGGKTHSAPMENENSKTKIESILRNE